MSWVIAAFAITGIVVSGYSLFLLRRRAALLSQHVTQRDAREPGNDA